MSHLQKCHGQTVILTGAALRFFEGEKKLFIPAVLSPSHTILSAVHLLPLKDFVNMVCLGTISYCLERMTVCWTLSALFD